MIKKNNILVVGICAIVAIAIAIIISVVALQKSGLNDSFFVSDDNKLVVTLDGSEIASADGVTRPVKGHTVYYYSGDNITDMKAYYEYTNEEDAVTMFNFYKDNGSNEFKSVALDGKYLILTANESEYDKLTLSDVRDNIEAIRELQSIENDAATEEDEEGDYEIDTTEVRFEE